MPPGDKPPRPSTALFMIGVLGRCLHHLPLKLVGDFSALGVANTELTICGELLLQEGIPLDTLLGHDGVLGDCIRVGTVSLYETCAGTIKGQTILLCFKPHAL
eukprot:1176455-Prorocentrum_minimum.AAC.3